MRPFVVFNPAAGRAVAAERLRLLLSRLPGYELATTCGPDEAGRLAARAAEDGYDPIVVAGGDGLFAEVVNGLAPDPGRVRLALLPMGTGNDFARALGLSPDPGAALEALLEGAVHVVDAARLDTRGGGPGAESASRWFANATVTGLAGRVARRAHRGRKRRWGSLAYRMAALPALAGARPVRTELVLEGPGGEECLELTAHAVAVTNGPYAGGGVRVAPGARIDDGLLDVVVVPDLGGRELFVAVLRLLVGLEDGGRFLRRRARRVRLATAGRAWLNADGEDLAGSEAAIEVVPGALRVVTAPAPADAPGLTDPETPGGGPAWHEGGPPPS